MERPFTVTMGRSSSAPIEELPPELIAHIFSFLERPAPSDSRLHDQPFPHMLSDSGNRPLKSVSRVSKRWRAIALPFLFRHVFWAFDRWDIVFTTAGELGTSSSATPLDILSFIEHNGIGHYVQSLTMSVSDHMYGKHRLSGAAGSSRDDAVSDLGSLSLADVKEAAGGTATWSRHSSATEDSNWLWERIFDVMDPKRLTIIALPRMLASLLSRMLYKGDTWRFKDQYHILSLERDGKVLGSGAKRDGTIQAAEQADESSGASKSSCNCSSQQKRITSKLFTIRPWTSVLLNEGSSTQVYKQYEFFHMRPPSILGSLLGCEEFPNDVPLIPPTVRSFSYVAIFPLSSHFNSLVRYLPPLDRIFVQLVPRNDILEDPEEMRNVQMADLWMERNTCYGLVMRQLFADPNEDSEDEDWDDGRSNGWKELSVFESGDAADQEAWEMACVYVRMSGAPWSVEGDGILVRRPQGDWEPGDLSEDAEVGEGFELLSVSHPFLW
jgi:hypothetical protein